MYVLKIGSNSEFLKMEISPSFLAERCGNVAVEIKTSNFHGAILPWFELVDILTFFKSLEAMYETLKGSASFETLEKQFTLKLESKSGGHIELTGVAWSEACYGSKLEFCFSLDQTFIQEPLKNLERLALQIKANA
jgi:hypothetical protein